MSLKKETLKSENVKKETHKNGKFKKQSACYHQHVNICRPSKKEIKNIAHNAKFNVKITKIRHTNPIFIFFLIYYQVGLNCFNLFAQLSQNAHLAAGD